MGLELSEFWRPTFLGAPPTTNPPDASSRASSNSSFWIFSSLNRKAISCQQQHRCQPEPQPSQTEQRKRSSTHPLNRMLQVELVEARRVVFRERQPDKPQPHLAAAHPMSARGSRPGVAP
eukprot:2001201-Rhodomonas_salina.2